MQAPQPEAEPAASPSNDARRGPVPQPQRRQHYMCECHVTHNFFVRSVGKHLEYGGDDAAFMSRYAAELAEALQSAPSDTGGPTTAKDVLADVRRQRDERLVSAAEAAARASRIAREYAPARPEVYALNAEAFLAEPLREAAAALRAALEAAAPPRPKTRRWGPGPGTAAPGAAEPAAVAKSAVVRDCVADLTARGLVEEVRPGLFVVEVFTARFCDLLEQELAHFAASGLPCSAPNTMNRHGVILSELGFGPGLLDPLVARYADALASALLPSHTRGLDSHRAFTVLYNAADGGDRDLALHYDNAEVTLNINIGGDWQGGEVSFHGLATDPEDEADVAKVTLKRGWGVLHAGQELHKALPVTSGRRHNLVVWCRSSGVRNERCPMCYEAPRCMPTSLFGDEGFTVPPCRRRFLAGRAATPTSTRNRGRRA